MTLAAALQSHLAQRPEMPRPYYPDSAIAIAWQRAFQCWVDTKEALESAVAVAGVNITPQGHTRPACTPRADYEWRDIPKRKSRGTRPGGSRDYNRIKQAERRERVRQAVLEVQSERDAR